MKLLGLIFALPFPDRDVLAVFVVSKDFAVLGLEERDSGDVARRLGDEATFQSLAKRNIETLAKYRFNKIVSCDPHSFHVLKNEYGALGGEYQVLHHSTYMEELIRGQKLRKRRQQHFELL